MMNSIKYLKLDIRLIKGTLKYHAFILLASLFMYLKISPSMIIGYLFFFLILFAIIPFSLEGTEKCDKLYYMLPSKISDMVLGRFLYLIITIIIVWIINGSAIIYMSKLNILSYVDSFVLCLSGIVATIVCFCEYPIYYKFGVEKGKSLSMILYIVPPFIILSLPSLLKKSSFFTQEFLNRIVSFITINKFILPLLVIIVISILGVLSYLLSCFICEKKEI